MWAPLISIAIIWTTQPVSAAVPVPVSSDQCPFPVGEGCDGEDDDGDDATACVAMGACTVTSDAEDSITGSGPAAPGCMLDGCAVACHDTQICSVTLDGMATCTCAPGKLERIVNDTVVCVPDSCAPGPCHTGQLCSVTPDGPTCTGCSFGVPTHFSGEPVLINSTDGSFMLNGANPVALGLNNSLFTGFRFGIFGQTNCLTTYKNVAIHFGQAVWDRSEVGIYQRDGGGSMLRLSTDAVTEGHRINGVVDGGILNNFSTGIVFNGRSREISPRDHPTAGDTSMLRMRSQRCYSAYVQFWPVCEADACVQGGCTCSDAAEGAASFCPACGVDRVGIASCSVDV
jgi:hypothetical protein